MCLSYKKEESKTAIEHFANNCAMQNGQDIEENISYVSESIDNLKNGIELLRSCQIINNELNNANCQNISCNLLFDAKIIDYIIPLINPITQIDLLDCAMHIINKASWIDQSIDSPLQDEIFIQNLISIFQTINFIRFKIMSLNIILNLIRDENISNTVFLVLNKFNFIQDLVISNFFDLNYSQNAAIKFKISNPSIIASEVLLDYLQFYPIENLINLVEIIPLLSNGIINKICHHSTRKNYAQSLSIILQNQETHPMAYESKLPDNCITVLSLYHDDSISGIFDCIYYLLLHNDDLKIFLEPTFIRLCTHLLETIQNPHKNEEEDEEEDFSDDDDALMHILRFLDFYLPKYMPVIETKYFFQILVEITLHANRPFLPRITASLILIKCINYTDQSYISILFENHFLSFVFDNINSYDNEDIVFILNVILKAFETNEELKNLFLGTEDFQNMLQELSSNDDAQIINLLPMFNFDI